MIVEIPTPEEFSDAALNHLNLAWDIAFRSIQTYKESHAEDWDDGEAVEEYWTISQPELGNAYTLIMQALEFALKARISEISPYLLLARDIRDWPRKSDKRDVSFSEFRTVDAADLVRLCNSVCKERLPEALTEFFDGVRRQRNIIVHHGVGGPKIDAYDLMLTILRTHRFFWDDLSWPKIRSNQLTGTSILFGPDLDMDNLLYEFEIAIEFLRPRDAKHFFGFNKRARRYLCPHCTMYCEASFIPLAQLKPNTSKATSVYCFICETETPIRRSKCRGDECRSNVICADSDFDDVCLVCWRS